MTEINKFSIVYDRKLHRIEVTIWEPRRKAYKSCCPCDEKSGVAAAKKAGEYALAVLTMALATEGDPKDNEANNQ